MSILRNPGARLLQRVVIAEDGRPLGTISRATLLRWFRNLALSRGLVDSPCPPDTSLAAITRDSKERLGQTTRKLADQIADLNGHLNDDADLVPFVVGGVTRMQDLLCDLLAHARYANQAEDAGDPLESLLLNAPCSD